jgi:hypothetical protein
MRSGLAVVLLVAGAALVAAGAFYYFDALDAQRREQARLDREWLQVQEKYARHVPPALPPARPAPTPLHGLPASLGLATAGVVLGAGGLALLVVARLTGRRSPPTL